MQAEEGSTVEFTYTDKDGNTEHWSGEVTTAKLGEEWFRLDTGESHPRTFRYDRVVGRIHTLAYA